MQHQKPQFTDGYWLVDDGLRLHYRDYAGPKSKPPIICLPGLTRNARDFAHVAERLSPDWRVICVELRGRGESAYARSAASYAPLTYLGDLEAMLDSLKIKKFVALGTSLGGILTMLLASAKPGRVIGALLNDVGPELEVAGLNRIKSYVGRSQSWPTWVHAGRWMMETQGATFPAFRLEQWIDFAKRICRLTAQGRIVLDYDMKLAEPMRSEVAPIDLWPMYKALGSAPVAILRGQLSDLFAESTARRMVKELPNARLVTVKNVGHAPMLDEPESIRAIDALLKSITA